MTDPKDDGSCQDCGEERPSGRRRKRCPRCGLLICGWCWGHVHVLEIERDKRNAKGPA